jgi:hypothetical protein
MGDLRLRHAAALAALLIVPAACKRRGYMTSGFNAVPALAAAPQQ